MTVQVKCPRCLTNVNDVSCDRNKKRPVKMFHVA